MKLDSPILAQPPKERLSATLEEHLKIAKESLERRKMKS